MIRKYFAKVHLWISIPFGIIISLLCLTGAVLVFESEIKELFQPSLYKVSDPNAEPLPLPRLMEIVTAQLPDTVTLSSIQVPSDPKKNLRLGIEGGGRTSLMVDPSTGNVKGIVRPYDKNSFFSFARLLHRWFLFEYKRGEFSFGKLITGVSTLMFVFILLSGLIIWLPRTAKDLKRRLKIKTGAGRFRFWYDAHLAGGKYAAIFLLTMSLTGLTWSFNWYREGFYKLFGVEIQQSPGGGQSGVNGGVGAKAGSYGSQDEQGNGDKGGVRHENFEGSGSRNQHYENNETMLPGQGPVTGREVIVRNGDREVSPTETDRRGGRRPGAGQVISHAKKYAIWEQVIGNVTGLYPRYRAATVQDGKVSVSLSNRGNTRASDSYTFDPATGEISGTTLYKDQPKSAKIRGWIYSVHVGSWGGMTTKILYFLACLFGTALPITGYYIWFKKRYKKWKKRGFGKKLTLNSGE